MDFITKSGESTSESETLYKVPIFSMLFWLFSYSICKLMVTFLSVLGVIYLFLDLIEFLIEFLNGKLYSVSNF
jgi:hypothetical protein